MRICSLSRAFRRCLPFAFLLLPSVVPAAEVDWSVDADFDSQVYPSYVITAKDLKPDGEDDSPPDFQGDPNGTLGVWISQTENGSSFKVTLHKGEYWDESSLSGTIPQTTEGAYIVPKVNYRYDKLREVSATGPVTATFDLTVHGQKLEPSTVNLTVHPLHECPYALMLSDDQQAAGETSQDEPSYIDLGWMFAAYVNENHPLLDGLSKAALDLGLVKEFSQYDGEDANSVYAQVYAVWHILDKRGVHYSKEAPLIQGESKLVHSRYVRFIEEAFDAPDANSIDGSILLASLLKKIGLDAFLVNVPGHMSVGVYLDPDQNDYLALDPSLLGATEFPPGKEIAGLRALLPKQFLDESSLKTFEAAVETGTKDLKANADKIEAETDPDYQLIDIQDARDEGVAPLQSQESAPSNPSTLSPTPSPSSNPSPSSSPTASD